MVSSLSHQGELREKKDTISPSLLPGKFLVLFYAFPIWNILLESGLGRSLTSKLKGYWFVLKGADKIQWQTLTSTCIWISTH